MRRLSAAAAAGLALAVPPAIAAPEEFNIDPAHTYPGFAVRHLGISTQRGRFDKTIGKIVVDRDASKGSVDITIDTTSISTGSPQLDRVLRGEDFFDVENHPRIIFKSRSVQFERGVLRSASGDLTMLGVTKPVMLDIEHFGCTRLPLMVRTTCGADMSTTVSRSAFGMDRYAAFIADDVRIVVQVEAVRVEPVAEPPLPGG